MVAYKEACNFSKCVRGVEETSSKCCKFLSVEECSSSFQVSSFKFKSVEESSSSF